MLAYLGFRALSTLDVSRISSSLKGGHFALVESTAGMFCCALPSLIGEVADRLLGVVREVTVERHRNLKNKSS